MRWSILALLALVISVRKAVLVVTVTGDSMSPALRHGDRVLVLRRRFAPRPRRDSIVVATPPPGVTIGTLPNSPTPTNLMVKRVTALPGDLTEHGPVPPNHLYLTGDASNHSTDSRRLGPIPAPSILGTVIRKLPTGR